MSVQRIVEDTPPIELQAEAQYDEGEPLVSWQCEGTLASAQVGFLSYDWLV